MNASDRLIEQIIILRCQTGDKDAFAELIERYQAPLRYFIRHLSSNSEVTDDIFQDTWLTVIRHIYSLKRTEAFPTWLYRIARNRVYQKHRVKENLRELNENVAAPNDTEDDVYSPEDAAKIHRCLKRLRPEHREVLMLRFLEQMSYHEIAQVINCGLGTVKSRIYYAKLALKKEMEK
ncbi:MAG: sigma-70 family RNA polymerase sigma factor [Phycisphaerae bacterium]|nr:sigma-70 family RNA polymerase sigma factor [Phycisphaerae bacterium]